MQIFLLDVELKPMDDEILQAIEHVLLDEPEIAGQFLMVYELLYLIIEANPLHRVGLTKFL